MSTHLDLDDVAATSPVAARELAELRAEIERLHGELGHLTECPCCGERTTCVEDCTFPEDCPKEYEQMMFFRSVLHPA